MQPKEEIIYLKNRDEYLSSVISEIPINAIIYKKITGIGATTLEIESRRNSIIIEPNTPAIERKTKSYPCLLGVYEGIKTSQIVEYLQNDRIEFKKLMTTPESFEKIKKAFFMLDIDMYDDYFLLFDECHKLTSEIHFRETISLPIQDFWKFKKRSLISATITNFKEYPIFQKSDFKRITIQPEWVYTQKINLYSSNNILQDIKLYLNNLDKGYNQTICFFVNSIDIITSIINVLEIKDEANIYCAHKSVEKLIRKKYNNVFAQLTELNKYNFYTSRFFSAVDIIVDYKPHVVIITDAVKAPQTIIEPMLETKQIAGRFRNGISSLTHIANLDKDIQAKTSKELKNYLKEQRKAYIQLKTFYNSAIDKGAKKVIEEALERVEISKYVEIDDSFNYFMRENLIDMESAKAKYRTWKDFVLSYSLDEEFFEIEDQYNNHYDNTTEKLKISSNNNRLLRKQIVDTFFINELDKAILADEQGNLLQKLKKQDEFIVEICQNFDKEFIIAHKYNKQQLTLALVKKQTEAKKLTFPVLDAVLRSFKTGITYTEDEIITILTKIYKNLGVDKKPMSTDIKNYFEISSRKTTKRKDGYKKGYKILKTKFI